MPHNPSSSFLAFLAHAIISLIIIIVACWGSFALYYQLSAPRVLTFLVIGLWGILTLTLLSTIWFSDLHAYRKITGLCFTVLFVLLLIWWYRIEPRLDRDWAPEVSKTVTAEIDGNNLRLHNIRDFDWRTESDFTENWKSSDYKLDQITGVDLFLSYWTGPAIAHTLVSFSFSDGRHLVFSAEIRKKRGQAFSEIGGFFKQFELAMIAAEESDIIYLRTNVRGEHVYRYPVDITPEQAQELFLLYMNKANDLSKKPAFYNTLTANCTTVVFDMARVLAPSITLDYRVLLSGYLPEYMYDNGYILTEDKSAAAMRAESGISQRAQGTRADYSQRIRETVTKP